MSEVGEFDSFIRPRVGEIAAAREEAARRGGEDLSFGDFIDLINPLHHLPIIGSLYRELTGDEIKPAAQVLGGLLFGGPVGMVSGVSHAIAEEATGKSVNEHIMTALLGENDETVADAGLAASADTPVEARNAGSTAAPATAAVSSSSVEPFESIAPAAGGAHTATPSAASSPPPVSDSHAGQAEPPLEGAAALHAFLRDRSTAAGAAQSSIEPPDLPIQKSDAGAVDGQSASMPTEIVARQAGPTAAETRVGRFMPVKPEHFTGRMAVRGPTGFLDNQAGDPGGPPGAAESPFAARMMEALKKYAALQEGGANPAASAPQSP